MNCCDVKTHYDLLVNEGDDPVRDTPLLRAYMDKWDGQVFVDELKLRKTDSVLEIGVGTGRLAVRVAPKCKRFTGIDLSEKTIERAEENLKKYPNVMLACGDFLNYAFSEAFDRIYSSLTFFHIKEKEKAFVKAFSLLKNNGRFVLSIDKNISDSIDMMSRKVKLYPDDPQSTEKYLQNAGFRKEKSFQTEFAYIFVMKKQD